VYIYFFHLLGKDVVLRTMPPVYADFTAVALSWQIINTKQ